MRVYTMEIDGAPGRRKPGTYVVTVSEEGDDVWVMAPNSVIVELLAGVTPPDPVEMARRGEEVRQAFGLQEVPDTYKPSEWPDCSLDTDEGCDMWIRALYDAMIDHRGWDGAAGAIDTFLLDEAWGSDQRQQLRDEMLKSWFALAKSTGLSLEQAARALIDRETRKLDWEGKKPSSHRLYTTHSVAAVLKEYRRALVRLGPKAKKKDDGLRVQGENCVLVANGYEARFLAQWKIDNE
jgi:hypothetical protein